MLMSYIWWSVVLASIGFFGVSFRDYYENLSRREIERETAENRHRYMCLDKARAAEMRLVSECDAYGATMNRDPRAWALMDTMESWRLCGQRGCYDVISEASDKIIKMLVVAIFLFVAIMFISKRLIGFNMSRTESMVEYLPTVSQRHMLDPCDTKKHAPYFRIRGSPTSREEVRNYGHPRQLQRAYGVPYIVECEEGDNILGNIQPSKED